MNFFLPPPLLPLSRFLSAQRTNDSTFASPGNKRKLKECELNIFSEVEKTTGNEKITNIQLRKKSNATIWWVLCEREEESLAIEQKEEEEKTHEKNERAKGNLRPFANGKLRNFEVIFNENTLRVLHNNNARIPQPNTYSHIHSHGIITKSVNWIH